MTMKYNSLLQGLQILEQYQQEFVWEPINEHYEFNTNYKPARRCYIAVLTDEIPENHAEQLKELGWVMDDEGWLLFSY